MTKTMKAPAMADLGVLKELSKHVALKVRKNEWTPEVREKAEELNMQLATYQVFRARFGGLRKIREKLDIEGPVYWTEEKVLRNLRAIAHVTKLTISGDEWTDNVIQAAKDLEIPLPCYATARHYIGYFDEITKVLPVESEKRNARQQEMLDAFIRYHRKYHEFPKRGSFQGGGKSGWSAETIANAEAIDLKLPAFDSYKRHFQTLDRARQLAFEQSNGGVVKATHAGMINAPEPVLAT